MAHATSSWRFLRVAAPCAQPRHQCRQEFLHLASAPTCLPPVLLGRAAGLALEHRDKRRGAAVAHVEGDFLDALEAITVVENFENMAPESGILESQLLLTEYFGQTEGRDEQKDAILTDLAMLLKDFSDLEGTEDLFLE